MNCERCGRVAAAGMLETGYTYCPSCALFVCRDCWTADRSLCESCAAAPPAEAAAAPAPARTAGTNGHASRPAANPIEVAPTAVLAAAVATPVTVPMRQPEAAAALPAARLRPSIVASIRDSIGSAEAVPIYAMDPTLTAPRPMPVQQAPPPRRAAAPRQRGPRSSPGLRLLSGLVADLPFRLALGAILAVSATFAATHLPASSGLPPEATSTPAATTRPPARTPATARPGVAYHVRRGDTLRSIAAHFFGDERRWRTILRANPGLDPNNLSVGQRLVIPR